MFSKVQSFESRNHERVKGAQEITCEGSSPEISQIPCVNIFPQNLPRSFGVPHPLGLYHKLTQARFLSEIELGKAFKQAATENRTLIAEC